MAAEKVQNDIQRTRQIRQRNTIFWCVYIYVPECNKINLTETLFTLDETNQRMSRKMLNQNHCSCFYKEKCFYYNQVPQETAAAFLIQDYFDLVKCGGKLING